MSRNKRLNLTRLMGAVASGLICLALVTGSALAQEAEGAGAAVGLGIVGLILLLVAVVAVIAAAALGIIGLGAWMASSGED